MKKIYALFLITVSTVASAQNLEWARRIGGTGTDMGHAIAVDNLGNVYATGIFMNTVDFDPGVGVFNLTSAGSWDIYIQKLDSAGIFQWAKRVGSTGDDRGHAIATDGASVYITGMFSLTVDFDPGAGIFNMTSGGSTDEFAVRLDAAGNFVWANRMGGSGDDRGNSIALDASSNVHITGYFTGNVSGIANLNSAGQTDIFILKLTSAGTLAWSKKFGNGGLDEGNGITVSSNGNVYSTGTFQVTVNFGSSANFTTVGGAYWDIYILKLSANGNFVWAKQIGSVFEDRGFAVTTDAAENVYTTGYFSDVADFDPGTGVYNLTGNSNSKDPFIVKLDAAGNFVWAKNVGSWLADHGYSIDVDGTGNVYTTGYFQSVADFDPGPGVYNMTANGQDIFLLKLTSAGNFGWAIQFGSSGGDGGYASTTAVNGSVYASGWFWQTTDFDPGPGIFNLTSIAGADVYIVKLNEIPLVLPVELLTFTAVPVNNSKVKLNWITASETNNDYFTVERSLDAYTWEYVTDVDGSGNSNTALEYEAWDNQPYMGISYYLLKQTDFDGQFSYSNIVGVNLIESDEIIVLQNLSGGQLTIISVQMQADRLDIYDAIGQRCLSSTLKKDEPSFSIDISSLNPGIYFINLTGVTGNVAARKLVKL